MKILNTIVWLAAIGFIFPVNVNAQQNKENEFHLKMIKDDNGNKTVIDTVISFSGLTGKEEIEKIEEILKDKGITVPDEEFENLKDLDNAYFFDADENEAFYIVKKDNENEDGEKLIKIFTAAGDSLAGVKQINISGDGDNYIYAITDENSEVDSGQTVNKKYIINCVKSGDSSNNYTFSNGMNWTGNGNTDVEVESSDDGKVIKITDEDGTVHEYKVDENGIYMIGKDGEIKKIGKDDKIEWNGTGNGAYWVSVDGKKGNSNVVVKSIGDGQMIPDFNEMEIDSSTNGNNVKVFVKTETSKSGNKTVVVERKVILKRLNDEDRETLEKSGLKIDDAKKELNIANLKFSPNPTNGLFTLEFSSPEKANTHISIYDVSGREIYHEEIQNFEGNYKKDIDISAEKKGTYFLRISQGNKADTKKIILE